MPARRDQASRARLLVVDDSALMRRLIGAVFANHDDFELATARNGLEALAMLAEFQPDVVTLDVHMPEMDGLACLDRIMLDRPCPVIMVASPTADGARVTLEALELGAVEFIAKPAGALSLAMEEFAPLLVEKVRQAVMIRPRRSHRLLERVRRQSAALDSETAQPLAAQRRRAPAALGLDVPGLVLVGSSTGGPPALEALLGRLPADFPWPVLVAQHMPATFTLPLAQRLGRLCALPVFEAGETMKLAGGQVYIGHGDADIVLARQAGSLVVKPVAASPGHRWHPSVERLVDSARAHFAARQLVGVLMTGMGNDGAIAMTRLRQDGGHTIAEAEATAVVWGMPGELVRAGGAERVARLDDIADHVCAFVPYGRLQ